MRRDTAQTRRVLPDREWWIAVADHAWGRLDKKWQHVSKDFRRDCHDAVGSEKCAEQVGVAERVDDPQLREHPSRQAEVHADRGDVPAADTAAKSNYQLEVRQRRHQRVYQRIGRLAALVDDGSPADLEHMIE